MEDLKLQEQKLKRVVIILAVGLLFVLPSAAWGDDAQNYVTAGAGLYFYTGDITRETQLDEAFIGELSYGTVLSSQLCSGSRRRLYS